MFTFLLLIGLLLILLIGSSFIVSTFERYTRQGDVAGLVEYKMETYGTGTIGYIINWLATIIGPFPTLLSSISSKQGTVLYGPGLYLKMFLSLPFVMSIVYIIRNRIRELYPLLVFCLIEMFSLAMIFQAFELRKGLPHCPFIFLIAFWYFDVANDKESECQRIIPFWYCIVPAIVLGWNILR